jgi:methionyl-tRNA formyltransferase
MKILILTSSLYGTASHHLNYLVNHPDIDIRMVIFNEGLVLKKGKQYSNKIRKIVKIGLLGALNGIRMREWYTGRMKQYVKIENLETECLRLGLIFRRTKGINCEITQNLFREAGADIGISLGNSYIGKKIFTIPRYGMINIHHELLPQYQNAQSVIWQLYNGSAETGYTIHKIDSKIDNGAILYQEMVPIAFKETLSDTVAYTSALLLKKSAKDLVKTLEKFDNYYLEAKPQGPGTSYTTPTLRQFIRILGQFKKLKRSISH